MEIRNGQSASRGSALGLLRIMRPVQLSTHMISQTGEEAIAAFHRAVKEAEGELRLLQEQTAHRIGEEEAGIFSVQRMLLTDEDFTAEVIGAIREGRRVEEAIQHAATALSAILEATEDEYLSKRTGDIRDIAARLIRILAGTSDTSLMPTSPCILAVSDLSPSSAASLDPEIVLGLASEEGSIQGHTAILCRTLGIPSVVRLGKIPDEWDGQEVLLRGDTGELILAPDRAAREAYEKERARLNEENKSREALRGKPTVTADGREIFLFANASTEREIKAALENDAEGIGLFRSELLFLAASTPPNEEEQTRCYRSCADLMGEKRLIIRTLDIGADKTLPYWEREQEENPALGLRAIRFSLKHPDRFLTQLRAILRASHERNVSIMLPMIATVSEVREAKALLAQAKDELAREGIPFAPSIPLGIMIETPAAALIAPELAAEVDFFSIGTNDLVQYTLAADRQNPTLTKMLPADHPAVLRLMQMAIDAAHDAGIWCGVCGEMGSDLTMTARLIKMGVDELSVLPSSILPIRAAIRACSTAPRA